MAIRASQLSRSEVPTMTLIWPFFHVKKERWEKNNHTTNKRRQAELQDNNVNNPHSLQLSSSLPQHIFLLDSL